MNMKRFLFPLLLAGTVLALLLRLFAEPASAKPISKRDSYDAIDDYVEGQMHRLNIPGASLAIVEGDKIVHLRGFGKARPGGETPTPQTPFALGSTTKSVTALAVMQLVETGRVELDAPVQHYLPWFRVADPQASAQITVRHLLNQTSGMSMIAGTICLADLDDRPDAAERQARALSTLKLNHPVGTCFQYCNLNYNLLGLIIEAASGQSYAEYVREHIIAPLDMSHTYTSLAMAKQNGLAMGHRYWFGIPIAVPDMPFPLSALPAGGLISTSEDMAHYLIAYLNGGRYEEAQILSSASIDEMHRGVAEEQVMGASVAAYGMGWFVNPIGGTTLVAHGGNVPDFSSFLGLLPEQKKGIVLLVNADHGFPFILMEVGERVAELLAGGQPSPIRLGFLPWMMRASLLIPLLQMTGILATLLLLRRWRHNPALRPSSKRMWGRHILLPLIPNLTLAAILGYLWSSGLLRFMHLYMPDLSWIARICGGFAVIWAFLRTGLILRTLRRP
jgi:CubicO group peptidase (beta-lactamase class C family)